MLRITCLAILLVSQTALGNPVDDQLGLGVLGVAWGTKLETVQERFPGGYTWETTRLRGNHFAYEVQVPTRLFGMDETGLHVKFFFNKHEQLQDVHLHYKYDQKDVVLYQVATFLGQNYRTRSDKLELLAQWQSDSGILITLATGIGPPYTWETLSIDARKLVDK